MEINVGVFGDIGVGKSTLVHRFIKNVFNPHVAPTIGMDMLSTKIHIKSQEVSVQFTDFASGWESNLPEIVVNRTYQHLKCVIIVYDVSSSESFRNVENYITAIKKRVDPSPVMLLVANKSDLPNSERGVSFNSGTR
jgi:small GTP-binding protein